MIQTSLIAGLMLGFSLIIAIGAQNTFLLKQGILKQHVFWLCLFCAMSDAILIICGVFGFAPLLGKSAIFILIMKYLGVTFLFSYAMLSFWRAYQGGNQLLIDQQNSSQSLKQALALCFAFTWLNPHVYLDIVILLGSVSSQYPHKIAFASGTMLASFIFFFSLGYLARFLRPIFAQARAWQILDSFTGLLMLFLAGHLLFH